MSDDDKKLILARRARFVAAALAGVSVACGKDPAQPPQPCLSVAIDHRDAEPEPPPQPCLSPVYVEPDAGGADAASSDAATTDASAPTPCLSPPLPSATVVQPPKPPARPCLSVMRPPDTEKKTR